MRACPGLLCPLLPLRRRRPSFPPCSCRALAKGQRDGQRHWDEEEHGTKDSLARWRQ